MRGGAQLCSCFPSAWCRPHLAQSLLTPLGRSGPSSEGQVHLGTAGASNKLWPFPMSPNPEKEDCADVRQHQQTRPTPAWTATCMDTGAATDRDLTARCVQDSSGPALQHRSPGGSVPSSASDPLLSAHPTTILPRPSFICTRAQRGCKTK